MMNNVSIVGRMTKDADLRYTPNGVAVANFTLAINRPFKNQQGEHDADFINCVVWRKAAENLASYMSKGSRVGVEGRIQSRTYEDKDGKTVFVTEVIAESVHFLESKNESKGNNSQQSNQSNKQSQNTQNQGGNNPFATEGEPIDISDHDLPF